MRRILFTVAVLGVFALALAACDDTQTGDGGTTAPASPTDDVTASPSDGMVTSEEVTLEGSVSLRLADQAFLLTDPVLAEGTAADLGSEILVIVTGDAVSIEQGGSVVVTGTLHAAEVGDELASLEEELNVDLPEVVASMIGDTQLLLADSVEAS